MFCQDSLFSPPPKKKFKALANSLVINYWEQTLRQDMLPLPSLVYFRAEFSVLNTPHPVNWTPASNPYEVSKAVVHAKILSGKYRIAKLTSHWTNKGGTETLEHILFLVPTMLVQGKY